LADGGERVLVGDAHAGEGEIQQIHGDSAHVAADALDRRHAAELPPIVWIVGHG
jgi:hypothetical protein